MLRSDKKLDNYQETNILKMISLIYRKMQIYMGSKTADFGITSGTLPFIMIICENGHMAQNRFCEILDISKGTVAKSLAKLEEQGYVTREENLEDGRCINVYPTKKALDIYPYLVEIGEEWIEYITKGMTEIERMVFVESLKKVSGNISDYF